MIKLSQIGDTIVEVMIAIAVVSLVLGGAFAASDRSQKSIEQAQEHTEALTIAQSQVELLRLDSAAISSTNVFCYVGIISTTLIDKGSGSPAAFATTPPYIPTDNLNYNVVGCTHVNGVEFDIAINKYHPPLTPAGEFVFTVFVRWDSIQGTARDQVSIDYKVG